MVNVRTKDKKAINSKGLKTVEICRMFDISKSTLFRWEKEGVISNIGRDWRNWRTYSQQNLNEIKKIIGRMKN